MFFVPVNIVYYAVTGRYSEEVHAMSESLMEKKLRDDLCRSVLEIDSLLEEIDALKESLKKAPDDRDSKLVALAEFIWRILPPQETNCRLCRNWHLPYTESPCLGCGLVAYKLYLHTQVSKMADHFEPAEAIEIAKRVLGVSSP